jgi:hypothetical protein
MKSSIFRDINTAQSIKKSRSFEMSVHFQRTTRRYIPYMEIHHSHRLPVKCFCVAIYEHKHANLSNAFVMCTSTHFRVTKAALAEHTVFFGTCKCLTSPPKHNRFYNIYFIYFCGFLYFGCTIKLFWYGLISVTSYCGIRGFATVCRKVVWRQQIVGVNLVAMVTSGCSLQRRKLFVWKMYYSALWMHTASMQIDLPRN